MKTAGFARLLLCVTPTLLFTQAGRSDQAGVVATYGTLPLSFEANYGQMDPRVKFLSRSNGYALFLTGDEAVLVLRSRNNVSSQRRHLNDSNHDLQSRPRRTEKPSRLLRVQSCWERAC